jgi:hypothetical protein
MELVLATLKRRSRQETARRLTAEAAVGGQEFCDKLSQSLRTKIPSRAHRVYTTKLSGQDRIGSTPVPAKKEPA